MREKRASRRRRAMMQPVGGGTWAGVVTPDAVFDFVPFAIQQKGRVFRADPAFDLRTHANIAVAKTYYVDKSTGNNANSGADWANALADLKTAYAKADVDRVVIRGYYFYSEVQPLPTRSVEVIAGDNNTWITSDVRNEIGVFAKVGNHYEAAVGGSKQVSAMLDRTLLNAFGKFTRLTYKSSIAEVDAAAGSFWQDPIQGGTVYVRTFDDRAPDADLIYRAPFAFAPTIDNRSFYFENLYFMGAVRVRNASAAGGTKAFFKNCALLDGYFEITGVNETIFQNCSLYKPGGDGINYDVRNGILSKAIEINCSVSMGGLGGASDQASTSHNGCVVVRIGGNYGFCGGQVIADVINAKTWNLGVKAHDSLVGVGFYTSGLMWLDSCSTTGGIGSFDRQRGGGTLFSRAFIGSKGVDDGAITAY
jgi:hypothetical protein